MRAGGLRYVIDIYNFVNTKNDLLQTVQIKELVKTIRADRKSLSGDEIVNNDQVTPISQVLFTIRYDDSINESMVIGYDNKFYNIRYIEHFKVSYTKITCSKIK